MAEDKYKSENWGTISRDALTMPGPYCPASPFVEGGHYLRPDIKPTCMYCNGKVADRVTHPGGLDWKQPVI